MGARRVVPVRACASRASGDGGGERNGSGRATAFQKSIRVTFIPGNGFGRAGVDSEPERGNPPSVGKPGDLQLGFAIGPGVLGHLSSASEGLTGPAGELILIAHRLF